MIDIIARGMIEESNGDISQISEKVNNHTEDSDIHVTTTDKENWNSHPNDVQAEGNPVQMDNLQGGVPFSEITVSGKNLIPFPYYDGMSKTANGITFTVNADGTIIANGTATASAIFYISTNYTIKKGIYTLSGCPKSDSNTDYVLQFATGDWSFKISDFGNGATTQIDNDINLQIFRIAISSGVVCDNIVFRPQLELGSTPTAYEPPITGRDLTVGVCGKNLLKVSIPTEREYVINNTTFTINDDGSVTATSSKIEPAASRLSLSMTCPPGDYIFSGSTINGFTTYIYNLTTKKLVAWANPNPVTCHIDKNNVYQLIFMVGTNCKANGDTCAPQLEIGSTATPYEPYNGSVTTITPTSNPYIIPNDIRQQDGLNIVSVSEGELSVTGVRKNAAIKRIWDEIDEIKTAIIVSNGESE